MGYLIKYLIERNKTIDILKLFFGRSCREVKLYRMLVREVNELLRSIDFPYITSLKSTTNKWERGFGAWLDVKSLLLGKISYKIYFTSHKSPSIARDEIEKDI